MTQYYKIEHYNVCGLVVAAVKALDNRVLQAWAADAEQKRMIRDGRLIADIECDSRVRPISKMVFDAYCAHNDIQSEIPLSAILCSLRLHGLAVPPPANDDMHNSKGAFKHSALAIS
ncbi:MAG TPA: hypothetical protein VGD95_03710 [Micavibrio sp.]